MTDSPARNRPARLGSGRVALTGSLRRKLVLQFLAVAAVVAVALFFAVRVTADRAAEAAQDAVLGAATIALSEGLRAEEDGLDLDLPPTTFSMLSAMGEDRVFYRVTLGSDTVTGYGALPLPATSMLRVTAASRRGVSR